MIVKEVVTINTSDKSLLQILFLGEIQVIE